MATTDPASFRNDFDCVVMLTWSDWKTEPRGNRYHYATRFARHLPVLFVQPDAGGTGYRFEQSEVDDLTIVHVGRLYGVDQTSAISNALRERRLVRPLLWAYNVFFSDFAAQCFSPLKVYHATEDYFSPDFYAAGDSGIRDRLRGLLGQIDLLVAVSEGVAESYCSVGGFAGDLVLLPNGCDFAFWRSGTAARPNAPRDRPVALFQGGINSRLDASLIGNLLALMPDWEFWFCGKVDGTLSEWGDLRRRPNLRYLGELAPTALREAAHSATAGIIPFVQNDMIVARSLPLKAFEYAACGLPTVSVPIRSLEAFPRVFRFAATAEEFATALRAAGAARDDPEELALRLKTAEAQDYDRRFEELLKHIDQRAGRGTRSPQEPLNILILYDPGSTHVATVQDHLESFSRFSRHRVFYAPATGHARCQVPFTLFDVVVIHYSVRVSVRDHLAPEFAAALTGCSSLKILFIQDEYDTPEVARRWIERLGVHVVYTCVPERYLGQVYPVERFPHVRFVPTLTGYVPPQLEEAGAFRTMRERPILIGYRGRDLPYWYGNLGREKLLIGQRMREICQQRGLPVDIEWTSDKRIYGAGWFEFLASCRATLGTESGSNLFDDNGEIQHQIRDALAVNPGLSYEEAFERFLKPHEGRIVMNQISPKIFEAIALRTALVLFEGSYSDVIRPHEHYLPLRKDFSNVDEILGLLHDDALVSELTERAYRDIIESGRYSYQAFIQDFDDFVSAQRRRHNSVALLASVQAYSTPGEGQWVRVTNLAAGDPGNLILGVADLERVRRASLGLVWRRPWWRYAQRAWSWIPSPLRQRLKPLMYNTLERLRVLPR